MIWQYIGGAAVTGVFSLILLLINRRWQRKDKKEDGPLEKQNEAIEELRKKHEDDIKSINDELTVICYGVLAACKGLAEKGCDGPVHDAISTLEKHLNKKAHQ